MSRPAIGTKPVRGENPRIRYRWDGQPKRCPRKGEFYLSGAPGFEVAYRAPNDLSTPYFIAVRVSP